jgi:alpha-L-fucosidase
LFNVGPDGKGNIPEIGAKFLRETGKWIRKYPQVIYDAGPSPWGHALPWGDVTTNGISLYLSVFEWPQNGKLLLPGLENKIVSAELLNGPEISYKKEKGWTVFDVPYKPADSPISVIELTLEDEAESAMVNTNHGIYPNIQTILLAEFAEVSVAEKKEIRWMEKFGEWKHVNQISKWADNAKAEWTVEVFEPGYYYIDLIYRGEGRLVWRTITDEGIIVENQQAATEKYQPYSMGILKFKTAGKHIISVFLVEGNQETSSLKSVVIKPIK